MQALHHKLDVVLVQILPYNCSETNYSFCEDLPPAGLRPVPGCKFHPQTPLAPHYFSRSAAPGASAIGNMHKLKNLVTLGHVVFELCKRTDRHTDIFITILCTPSRSEVMIKETKLSKTCRTKTGKCTAVAYIE